jgi:hypothetical protein
LHGDGKHCSSAAHTHLPFGIEGMRVLAGKRLKRL